MKLRRSLILCIAVALLFSPVMALAAEETDNSITRGEFFNVLVAQLGWEATEEAPALPSDISEDSPYADSVRVLMERNVLAGYPDGTVKADIEISAEHAAFLITRLLGVTDAESAAFLEAEYGITVGEDAWDAEAASLAASNVLTNDQEALDLLARSTEQQLAQNSYRMDMTQKIGFSVKEGLPPEEAAALASLNEMSAVSEVVYHHESGMHMITSMAMPAELGLPGGANEMVAEQYIVPEGMFMSTPNPETGEVIWMKLPGELDFNELMTMQKESMQVQQAFNDDYFYYRYKGQVTEEEGTVEHIAFNGKIDSITDMLQMTQSLMPEGMIGLDEDLAAANQLFAGMIFSGNMYLDAESALPVKMEMELTLQMNDMGDPTMMPFDSMSLSMEMTFSDYGQVEAFALPAEAENAQDLGALMEGFDLEALPEAPEAE